MIEANGLQRKSLSYFPEKETNCIGLRNVNELEGVCYNHFVDTYGYGACGYDVTSKPQKKYYLGQGAMPRQANWLIFAVCAATSQMWRCRVRAGCAFMRQSRLGG